MPGLSFIFNGGIPLTWEVSMMIDSPYHFIYQNPGFSQLAIEKEIGYLKIKSFLIGI